MTLAFSYYLVNKTIAKTKLVSKTLFTLGNSQVTQRKLEYRQFELPVRRIPTGELVPHTENTVKRFSLPLAVVNPR